MCLYLCVFPCTLVVLYETELKHFSNFASALNCFYIAKELVTETINSGLYVCATVMD